LTATPLPSTKRAHALRVAIALAIAAMLWLLLWRLYRDHREAVGAIVLGIVVLYLIAELLEPFVWLAGLKGHTPSENSQHEVGSSSDDESS
jgi:hypothetical protein